MPSVSDWLQDGKCVVVCGGRGSRLAPYAPNTPKSLIRVGEYTILELLLGYWRVHARRFVFILNQDKEDLLAEVVRLGIDHEVVEETGPPLGIANALMQARNRVGQRFVVVLGDCLCTGSFSVPRGAEMGFGVARSVDAQTISQNYSVEVSGERVTRVVEKPTRPPNDLCGTGFYFFTPAIFDAIGTTAPSSRNTVELTDAIQKAVAGGVAVSPFYLDGIYINLNYPQDVETARRAFADGEKGA
jgi:dTDP-glucose pyrophosphorylase